MPAKPTRITSPLQKLRDRIRHLEQDLQIKELENLRLKKELDFHRQPWNNIEPWPKPKKEIPCFNEAYDKANPDKHGEPRHIACPCPKCMHVSF